MSIEDQLTTGARLSPSSAARDAVALARVVTDEPAAVLLVDLGSGEVVYANAIATELASVPLPVPASTWSSAAGLQTATGGALEASTTPLERVAAGQPVHGEVVTAARSSEFSVAREQLWVLGTPLVDGPEALSQHALVVFLPLRDTTAVAHAQQAAADLRHQAVLASEVAFTIADPSLPDTPLIWANPAFERATGYRVDDVVGRNCRFLQGPLTDPGAVNRIRTGLQSNGTVTETLLNYRADGTAFWNRLVISPVLAADGSVTHLVGVQTDVTERVDADAVRDAALAAAEAATRRQQALASISSDLADHSSDPADLLAAAPPLVTSHFWGWCAVVTLTADHSVDSVTTAYGQPPSTENRTQRRDTELAASVMRNYLTGPGHELLRDVRDHGHDAELWPHRVVVTPPEYASLSDDAAGLVPGMADAHAGRSLLAAPLLVAGRVMGLLTLSRPGEDELVDAMDIAAFGDIAARIGTAWDHARLYAAEHDVALTLQRSLLPRLTSVPGFDVAATYVPTASSEVGGDWFDVVNLPGPWLATIIGDVMGHDIRAAAVMGHLRSIVRTLAWQLHQPRELLRQLHDLVTALEPGVLATMLIAVIDDPSAYQGNCSVSYASAGHIPAFLRHPDGSVEVLDNATNPPVGVSSGRPVVEARTSLADGAALVLITDGLIERRNRDLDEGIAAVVGVLRTAPRGLSSEHLRDVITGALLDDKHDDDTCVLVVTRQDVDRQRP